MISLRSAGHDSSYDHEDPAIEPQENNRLLQTGLTELAQRDADSERLNHAEQGNAQGEQQEHRGELPRDAPAEPVAKERALKPMIGPATNGVAAMTNEATSATFVRVRQSGCLSV